MNKTKIARLPPKEDREVTETAIELEKLLVKHAQVSSGCSGNAKILASVPGLLASAVNDLEKSLRRTVRRTERAELIVLLDKLAEQHPGLDFSKTRGLLGL